jgi:hypothetical protein
MNIFLNFFFVFFEGFYKKRRGKGNIFLFLSAFHNDDPFINISVFFFFGSKKKPGFSTVSFQKTRQQGTNLAQLGQLSMSEGAIGQKLN